MWSGNKVDPSRINLGNEYRKGERVPREELNAIVNNSIYASNKSDEALEKANSAFMANGTVSYVGGVAVPTLNFDSDPQSQIDKAEKIKSVLYDMFSDDIDINHGDFDGITGATERAFTFDPTGAKGIVFYAKVSGVVYIRQYLDLTMLKEGLANEISCSPLSRNQHSVEVSNAYNINGVTVHVLKDSETEYSFGVPSMFSYKVTTNEFTFHNDDTSRYVYRVELVEE